MTTASNFQQMVAGLFGYKGSSMAKSSSTSSISVDGETASVSSFSSSTESHSFDHDEHDHHCSTWGEAVEPLHDNNTNGKKRQVCFNTANIQYIQSDRTSSDIKSSWYDSATLREFQIARDKSLKKLLHATPRKLSPRKLRKNDEKKQSQQEMQHAIVQAYQGCCSIKSEKGLGIGLDATRRMALQEAFAELECLWGLERQLVRLLRGSDASAHGSLVLANAENMVHVVGSSAIAHRRISSAMSRASRSFAREVAVAQAAALTNE